MFICTHATHDQVFSVSQNLVQSIIIYENVLLLLIYLLLFKTKINNINKQQQNNCQIVQPYKQTQQTFQDS